MATQTLTRPERRGSRAGEHRGDQSLEHRVDLEAADIAGTFAHIMARIAASDDTERIVDRRLDTIIANLESYRQSRLAHNEAEDLLHEGARSLLADLYEHRDGLVRLQRQAGAELQGQVAQLAGSVAAMMARFEAALEGRQGSAAA